MLNPDARQSRARWFARALTRCRGALETEIDVCYGTNEYNFTRLENPPTYKPTKCGKCGTVIRPGNGGCSAQGGRHWCTKCSV